MIKDEEDESDDDTSVVPTNHELSAPTRSTSEAASSVFESSRDVAIASQPYLGIYISLSLCLS